MSVSFRIVVATYKRPHDLELFLEAIIPALQYNQDVSLVVVNDASHDTAYGHVISKFSGKLEYRILPENVGPGAARHAAIEGAKEDYIIFTDDDCIPPKFWLPWIRAYVSAYPEVDLFAGGTRSTLDGNGTKWESLLNLLSTYPKAHFVEHGLLTAVTANAIIKRDAYEAAGGFSTTYRGASEDCYITQQVLRTGGTYAAPPIIETRHKANQSLRELRKRFRWYGKGGLATSFNQGNWMLAEIGSDGTLRDSLRHIRMRADAMHKNAVKTQLNNLSWVNKAVAKLVHWAIAIEYERGWRNAMRSYKRKGYGALPTRPKHFARFD